MESQSNSGLILSLPAPIRSSRLCCFLDAPFLARVPEWECPISRRVLRIQLSRASAADYNRSSFSSF
jgi:hypothetical protein